MNLRKLFNSFDEYLDILEYYDYGNTVGHILKSMSDIEDFIDENENKKVVEWTYYRQDNMLYVEIK